MSISIKLGNFLFQNFFFLYKPSYWFYKKRRDAFEIKILEREVKPGMIVLDIGANIGFYAEVLSTFVGKHGKVLCFEPDKKNFKHLESVTKSLQNVFPYEKAIDSKSGKINIYTSKELNVDHRTYKPEHFDKVTEVDSCSLDDFCNENCIPKVDFIKMDIQGYEMEALRGAEKILNNNSNVVILAELWPYGLKSSGSNVFDYIAFLQKHNFEIQLIEDNNLKILTPECLEKIKNQGKEFYYNILAKRRI